ncbi:MAG: SMP-30/gluconolactonase/LRE family protein, partial [Sphingobacterium sp.]
MLKERVIKRLNTPVSLHGEGPIWHYARGTAMWVDILSGTIIEYQLESSNYIVYACNHMVSAVFERFDNKNELIVTVKDGVGFYNLETQKFTLKTDLHVDWSNMRCNDGAVDSTGDLWMSTTHVDHKESFGELYCITKNWSAIKVIPQVTISNGPCWSDDNTKMFHTDSVTRLIKAYKFSEKQKIQGQGEIVISIPDQLGFPDGMAMDRQGTLWIAIWGGACVVGFDSTTGKQIDRISLPIPHVTSLAFVGEDMNKMLITTSQKDMDKQSLEAFPWSGYSFIIDMEVPGVKTYSC